MTLGPLKPWEVPETGKPAALAAKLCAGIPQLETERLVLRAPQMSDFPVFAEIEMSDHAKFMGGPLDRQNAFADFCICIASWHLNGYGLLTVEADGTIVGFCSLVRGYGDHEPELGWFFLPEHCGKGYATEAAQAVRDCGRDTIGVRAMVSYIDTGNAASIRVAEKLGAWAEPSHPHYDEDLTIYRHWPKVVA